MARKPAPKGRALRLMSVERLSRLTEEYQNSIQMQNEGNRKWAEENGHVITVVAADENVSGGIEPKKRPDLGPKLTDSYWADQYDGIVARSLDRYGRNARDLRELRNLMEDAGKKMILRYPHLEWPPPPGTDAFQKTAIGMQWAILEEMAEAERLIDSERISQNFEWMRSKLQWTGGRPRIGHVPICTCHGQLRGDCENIRAGKSATGWVLTIDPDGKALTEAIVAEVLRGRPLAAIARDLNHAQDHDWTRPYTEVAATRNWSNTVLIDNLRSPSLTGILTHAAKDDSDPRGKKRKDYEIVRHTGEPCGCFAKDHSRDTPIQAWPAVIDQETWDAVQRQLDAISNKNYPKVTNRDDVSMLSGGVLKCFCGVTRVRTSNDTMKFYSCFGEGGRFRGETGHGAIQRRKIDSAVDRWMQTHTYEIWAPKAVRDEKAEQLKRIIQQREEVNRRPPSRENTALYNELSEKYFDLQDEIAKATAPVEPKWVRTGRMLADEWTTWDERAKRKFLLENEFQVFAGKKIDIYGGIAAPKIYNGTVDQFNRVLCECGKLATTAYGTCTSYSEKTKDNPCAKRWAVRNNANGRARKRGQPLPYPPLDVDEIQVTVIPGLRYEAQYWGHDIYELYEIDPLAAEEKINEKLLSNPELKYGLAPVVYFQGKPTSIHPSELIDHTPAETAREIRRSEKVLAGEPHEEAPDGYYPTDNAQSA